MISLAPSTSPETGAANLTRILNCNLDKNLFNDAIQNLNNRFEIYSTTFPTSLIAPGLIVTPEIRRQSEIYLPISEIRRIFYSLYRRTLCYQPVLSSTPFHKALSWADVFVALSPDFQFSTNPARILETLLSDRELLTSFLFHSFLPCRFYGGYGRYPEQTKFIREWIGDWKKMGKTRLRCLDAACGTGEDTYNLAYLCKEAGFSSEEIRIEGWTLEPLEVWAAAHQRFPHYNHRKLGFRKETLQLFECGFQSNLNFQCVDLTKDYCLHLCQSGIEGRFDRFDLILCNGLLGGPIINKSENLEQVVTNLVRFLAPGGLLMAANSFHGGWQLKYGVKQLMALF